MASIHWVSLPAHCIVWYIHLVAPHESTTTASYYLKAIREGDSLKVSLNSKKIQEKKEKVKL